MKAKYIKTDNDIIIMFGSHVNHSKFKHWNPVSAGYITFGFDDDECEITCTCYGESTSLGLKADEKDSILAKVQLLL